MEDEIINAVVKVMLPLGETPAAKDALDEAGKIIWKLIRPLPGKIEVAINDTTARLMLSAVLDSVNYESPPGQRGRITDLKSYERLNLLMDTATGLANGYRQGRQGQSDPVLKVWPAQEFYRAARREKPRNWVEKWKAVGGRLFAFTGKKLYPTTSGYEGRMIALKDDQIWERLSAFGFPFPPFDFLSGMDVRDIERSEAAELGLIEAQQHVRPVKLPTSDEFRERFEAKLRQNLAMLEEAELKRLADPITYGSGDELLDLAEEKLVELEYPTPEQIQEIKSFVERAIELDIDEDDDRVAAIYEAMADPEQAEMSRQLKMERRVASLVKRGKAYGQIGMAEELLARTKRFTGVLADQLLALVNRAFETGAGAEYNLRARGDKILIFVYEQIGDAEKAAASWNHYIENADGFLLLENAKKAVHPIGRQMEPEKGRRILDMLTKAVQRIPENHIQLHAEAYCVSAEILEALGDNKHAIEYYEYALLKNPEIAVKRRLEALKKQLG